MMQAFCSRSKMPEIIAHMCQFNHRDLMTLKCTETTKDSSQLMFSWYVIQRVTYWMLLLAGLAQYTTAQCLTAEQG